MDGIKHIPDHLRRANTWMTIAVLALIGWLIDSFLWFFEGHTLTFAGFTTFLAHSWYALPLLAAIFLILRLHRPSTLLSLTIYDERGVPVHHQGDFQLDEAVIAPIFTSFKDPVATQELHALELPTGSVVYFLRQGGLTLVVCFSGSIDPHQLEPGLNLLKTHAASTESLLRDLPVDAATLAARLLNAPVERDLLIHLWQYRRTAMTIKAWGQQINCGDQVVATAMGNLERLGLVEHQQIGDMSFYRLTNNEIDLRRLEDFITWRTGWLTRAHRVEELVGAKNQI
ncbi:MAG: hypothetical protein FOGNACKC_03344 [Anaerolineae bacterium]|nr:hypothetical protein [Anaerolineae bacterium]